MLIGKFIVFDEDVGQILSFIFFNYIDVFMLKGDNFFVIIISLDYEVQFVYVIFVKCLDDGGDFKFVSLVLYIYLF